MGEATENRIKRSFLRIVKQDITGARSEISFRDGNSRAIAFLHGILGSPTAFTPFIEHFSKLGFDCHAFLLPGHGGEAKDFNSESSREWRGYALSKIAALRSEYADLTVMGHSMGGLFCIESAVSPAPPDRLILLNTPMKPKVGTKSLTMSSRLLFLDPERDDERASAYRDSFGVSNGRLIDYPMWFFPFARLLHLIDDAKGMLPYVKVPALILQSCGDESVDCSSAHEIFSRMTGAKRSIRVLPDSGHAFFPECDREKVLREMEKFMY